MQLRIKWAALILLFVLPLFGQNKKEEDKSKSFTRKNEIEFSNDQDTKDYLKMLENAFYKVSESYVDSVNESEIIKAGIKGMMTPLDPYTKFVSGSSKERLDMLRTGKYGGVGIQIGMRRDTLTVLAPFEDSPAYSEGIHSGDQIIMIDSVKTKGMTIRDASKLIKGELGTVVVLTVYRPSTREKIDFELTRANITIKHVPYWGVDENGIGYIRITKFSRNTAKDFTNALKELEDEDMAGLVIDLRSNSGGLLNNAINILDKLTDRGVNLLNTRGRLKKANKQMNSRRAPMISQDIPIAVLINKSSASASEIVAGVLQDLDRAIVVGEKSFGKGLVQSMYTLNDTTTLKVTTAKYYTPSGRLIQKEDYLNNGFLTDGLDKKDTLFTTTHGRKVSGGGGITPDVTLKRTKLPPYVRGLWREGVFLTFAADYVPKNQIKAPVVITDKIYKDFEKFLSEYEIKYSLPGENDLKKLQDALNQEEKKSGVPEPSFFSKLQFWKKPQSLSERMTEKVKDYYTAERKGQYWDNKNIKWIKNGLQREMSLVVSGEKEKIKVSLIEDNVYIEAAEILLDVNRYYDLLEPQPETADERVEKSPFPVEE
ncbi:MAG: S41 family peptidase [Candidatus Marinimicrobia bacterium]|nr:S41 family peptidase [Candidatus Neomarinimicrobiota bacterium]MDP6936684.1 S41 family peptidase [Candidatus Neomarinimicrobiota bacterium]